MRAFLVSEQGKSPTRTTGDDGRITVPQLTDLLTSGDIVIEHAGDAITLTHADQAPVGTRHVGEGAPHIQRLARGQTGVTGGRDLRQCVGSMMRIKNYGNDSYRPAALVIASQTARLRAGPASASRGPLRLQYHSTNCITPPSSSGA